MKRQQGIKLQQRERPLRWTYGDAARTHLDWHWEDPRNSLKYWFRAQAR